jgi:hypothetical protein
MKNHFAQFVNSIISERPKAAKVDHKPSAAPQTTNDGGDLALILAASTHVDTATSKSKQDRGGFNSGLGYAPSSSELATATQVQRLKNQIRRSQEEQAA